MPPTQDRRDLQRAHRDRAARGYRENPDVERYGWRETVRGNFIDATAPAGDASLCIVTPGNPPTEMLAVRSIRPNLKFGLVFSAASTPPSEWRSVCRTIEPLFDWLRTRPSGRSPAFGR